MMSTITLIIWNEYVLGEKAWSSLPSAQEPWYANVIVGRASPALSNLFPDIFLPSRRTMGRCGSSALASNPLVVCGADDTFAMPLAVTLASAIANLNNDRRLSIFVLDGGLSPASVRKIASLGKPGRVAIRVLRPDVSCLKDLPVSGHVNFCTYLRVLLPRVLPESVQRVIYLDSDLIVLADLGRLWDEAGNEWHCRAAQEMSAPVMNARLGLPKYKSCAQYLSTIRPVPNYDALGLPPSQKYFNGGVMLIDLAKWRRDDITSQLLCCLHDHRRHVRWWDQYALNVVLADKWGELDCRWNQTSQIYTFPSWDRSPLDEEAFEQLRSDPFIVHFNARRKPWHLGCQHPWREAFFKYVGMTPWAGARPARRPWSLSRWRRERVEDLLVFAGRRYRWLTARFR